MKFTLNKLSDSKIELKFEIPVEEFEKFIEKATLDLGKNLEVEGFRKGRAPKEIIENKTGPSKVLQEAAELVIRENYPKAIYQLAEENKIEAISEPEIEILKLAKNNPLEFKARVFVLPEIELPDYKKIAAGIKKKEVKVTPEEIEKIKIEKERLEKERLRQEILEKIAQNAKMEIPEILIEKEKNRILENLKRGVLQVLQISFEDYLKKLQKTEKEMLDSFAEEAEKRVKTSLVLREIGKKEDVEVTEEEITEEIKKVSGGMAVPKNQLDQEYLKSYTKEVLRNEKILERLEGFTKD